MEGILLYTTYLNITEDLVYYFIATVIYNDSDIFLQGNVPCHTTYSYMGMVSE